MNADPSPTANPTSEAPQRGMPGGTRGVIEAACTALFGSPDPSLVIVLETIGSTYVAPGAIALFAGATQTGWLSGGCLEPEIARRAAQAAARASVEWMEVDTRDDEALFSGSAVGCRGQLRLAMLPLRALSGWSRLAARWLAGHGSMDLALSANGTICWAVGDDAITWQLPAAPGAWTPDPDPEACWQLRIAPLPSALVFGAGPEAPVLLPLLRSMGWMTRVIEHRERWLPASRLADHCCTDSPKQALAGGHSSMPTAALVMHHHFELDLEALLALAANPPPFIGLLGPRRRRDDLFKLLPDSARQALLPHLHSPVGIDLGGRGPEAIALSIAAQLQSTLHGRPQGLCG